VTTISEALTAYRICAQAENRSPRTIQWIDSSARYLAQFLGEDAEITSITATDIRRFIISLQHSTKYRNHPYVLPQDVPISPQTIETYCRALRALFGHLRREDLIDLNPFEKIKIPKVPRKVVPTFTEEEVTRLLALPDRRNSEGFRDYVLMLVLLDTGARVSEIASLAVESIDLENGDLRVMGKGGKERPIPFGHRVAKALMKYKVKYRPEPQGCDSFFLTREGRPLTANRIERIVRYYGKKAGLERCYCHKFRHTSSVMYLRNGGDPFSLQKKLGHTSLEMTRHYCNLADSDVRAKHLRFGVVDRLKSC
jgi:integrase/recombinase XerD